MAKFGKAPGADRFAYLGLVAVSHDEAEARARGELIAGYVRTSPIVALPFRNPPGYLPAEDNARMLRGEAPPRTFAKDGRVISMQTASLDDLIAAGVMFCGKPDQVYEQLVAFCGYCGGMGNLLMMAQGGELTHAQTVDNLMLFAREVYPRLKTWQQPDAEAAAAAVAA
jgi:alkanesulfonate monooxygenase SsuD/methylene tetrahydromethanopterin reductase-like flavin-dependent oxidoreductase (luciferase family)